MAKELKKESGIDKPSINENSESVPGDLSDEFEKVDAKSGSESENQVQ